MNKTKISWTDQTANPIRARHKQTGKRGWHCVKVSPGCVNCYAERMNRGPYGNGLPFREDVRDDVELYLEYKVLEQLEKQRTGKKTFLCDMTDIFQRDVHVDWIASIWAMMATCQSHTFQILTKRADRMREILSATYFYDIVDAWLCNIATINGRPCTKLIYPLPNVWLGVSCENQQYADERIPLLLQTPAAVRFLSCEPLLGEIDLKRYLKCEWYTQTLPTKAKGIGFPETTNYAQVRPAIDWVIVGGESGAGYRTMNLDWARSIRDQCVAADVAFWFKQHSGPRSEMEPTLDGVEWHQFPKGMEQTVEGR